MYLNDAVWADQSNHTQPISCKTLPTANTMLHRGLWQLDHSKTTKSIGEVLISHDSIRIVNFYIYIYSMNLRTLHLETPLFKKHLDLEMHLVSLLIPRFAFFFGK